MRFLQHAQGADPRGTGNFDHVIEKKETIQKQSSQNIPEGC